MIDLIRVGAFLQQHFYRLNLSSYMAYKKDRLIVFAFFVIQQSGEMSSS